MNKPAKQLLMKSEKPRKRKASDVVFWGVVQGLEEHTFVPGQRLVEPDLMARFEVGRNSVREAIQRLAAEGIVDLSPHKGASIRVLSLQEALDLLDIVERILGLLCRTAARGNSDAVRKEALEQALQKLALADETRDAMLFSTARGDFYRALFEMSGNRDLRRLSNTIHIPMVYVQRQIPTLQEIRLLDYKNISEAVMSKNEEAADEAGAQHVRNVRLALLAAN
ncbi:MAG TPA: GntR family transcriptional regulator [Alcanivoracaceae bacterium]|nr:GntR family transcriptional regulator [Alcanivoracaceae bacterium]